MADRRRTLTVAAAVVAVLAVVSLVVVALRRHPGQPTAREAVTAYLDALARGDRKALRRVFTSGSSDAEIDQRLRSYGGDVARGATFRILESEPGVRGVPHAVDFTFPAAPDALRHDTVAVWERWHGHWLMLLEDPRPDVCASGAVCDASPTG